MIDRDGYRPNVAIVLVNPRNQVGGSPIAQGAPAGRELEDGANQVEGAARLREFERAGSHRVRREDVIGAVLNPQPIGGRRRRGVELVSCRRSWR